MSAQFAPKPVPPMFLMSEKEKRDSEIWNAITTAINLCGFYGEDVTILGIETLKKIGRYDLLPTCEKGEYER